VLATAGGILGSGISHSAEIYYQPVVQVSSAYNTNVLLEPGSHQSAESYYADASTLIGIATPNAETSITPRLLYNYYPTLSGLNRLEGFLSLNSRYNWRRDSFNINGFFDHRDDNNAAQPAATEANPTQPGIGTTTPSSGRVNTSTTRDWLILEPKFSHLVTPLSSIGVAGQYQRLDYSNTDQSGHIPFNYYLGRVFYTWTQNQRSDFTVSAFGAKYLAGTIDSTSTTGGVSGAMKYSWTQTLQSDLSASYDRTHFIETDPRVFDKSSNQWAAAFSTTYNGISSQYRASIGRSIVPGANGGLYIVDQLQGQYDRDLTARLHVIAAIRYFRDRTVNSPSGIDTRNYATPYINVKYMLTRQLFVAGAYSYIYQKYQTDTNSAAANRISLTFGYTGLGRQYK
jgi:hypothetical protein